LPIYANLNVQILGLMGMCLLQIPHNKLMKKGPKERLLMSLLSLDELNWCQLRPSRLTQRERLWPKSGRMGGFRM